MKIFRRTILILVAIVLLSHPAYARRVRDKGILFGTFADANGVYEIRVSNNTERLEVRAEAEDGNTIARARIDKNGNAKRVSLDIYSENKQEEGAQIEAGLGALLFRVIIGEARKEKISLLKINLTETMTRIFLETFRDSGYIINLKFYPKDNSVFAVFEIPLTPGVIPEAAEHKIP